MLKRHWYLLAPVLSVRIWKIIFVSYARNRQDHIQGYPRKSKSPSTSDCKSIRFRCRLASQWLSHFMDWEVLYREALFGEASEGHCYSDCSGLTLQDFWWYLGRNRTFIRWLIFQRVRTRNRTTVNGEWLTFCTGPLLKREELSPSFHWRLHGIYLS